MLPLVYLLGKIEIQIQLIPINFNSETISRLGITLQNIERTELPQRNSDYFEVILSAHMYVNH